MELAVAAEGPNARESWCEDGALSDNKEKIHTTGGGHLDDAGSPTYEMMN